jgi:hypothetical protein
MDVNHKNYAIFPLILCNSRSQLINMHMAQISLN